MALIKKHITKSLQAGVTLIEMLVVVGIIALVSSVLIFNYSDFSTNVSVRNLSQEIALAVRKAQTYATSVRPIEGLNGISSRTFPAFGVSFNISDIPLSPSVATPNSHQFILFADTFVDSRDQDAGHYEHTDRCGAPAPGDECLESFTFNTADKITSICGSSDGSRPSCYSSAIVDITYRRPSPDAIICMTGITPASSGTSIPGGGGRNELVKNESVPLDGQPSGRPGVRFESCSVSHVVVNLESAKGLKRSVTIWNTGQISVQ